MSKLNRIWALRGVPLSSGTSDSLLPYMTLELHPDEASRDGEMVLDGDGGMMEPQGPWRRERKSNKKQRLE